MQLTAAVFAGLDKVETAGKKIPGFGYVGEKYVERKIRFLFVQKGTARTRENIINVIFYSACIYDVLKDRIRPREETTTLTSSKTKIFRLHSKQFQSIFIDKHEASLFQREIPSLSHLLKLWKRCVSRMTTSVIDKEGVKQTANRGILHNFVESMQSKYDPIQMDDAFVSRMEKVGHRILPLGLRNFLDTPITEDELKAVVSKGACNKVPGRDGICLKFFKVNWDNIKNDMLALFNRMFLDGRIMEKQKHGIVMCIPKNDNPTTPAEYRQITLLNTDYKIVVRIRTNRLKPTLSLLHPSQYFEVPGTMIFDALTTVRDSIMYPDMIHSLLCNFPCTSHQLLTGSRILIYLRC